jgi:hypothetical protein
LEAAGANGSVITVGAGVTLILETDAVITGNTGNGGGVGSPSASGASATFRMSGNSAYCGSGVYGARHLTLTMNGNAVISGNTSSYPAVFYLYGGTIYGANASGRDADGIDLKNTSSSSPT